VQVAITRRSAAGKPVKRPAADRISSVTEILLKGRCGKCD
jgi:hypothetical protein